MTETNHTTGSQPTALAGDHFYGCQDAGFNEGLGGASGLGIQKDRVFTKY
jgi:hypothetical protein